MSLASVSIVGNLVRDPEQFQFESGRVKTSFHVAVNGFNRITKERVAEYYKIEVWDKLADLAHQYLKKGNQVTVVGRLTLERWTDKEGRARCTPVVSGGQLSLPQKPKFQNKDTDTDSDDISDQFDGKNVERLNVDSDLITASAS